MKLIKVVSLVSIVHLVLIVTLVLTPGCNTVENKPVAQNAPDALGEPANESLWVLNEETASRLKPAESGVAPGVSLVGNMQARNRPVAANEPSFRESVFNEGLGGFAPASAVDTFAFEPMLVTSDYTVQKGDSLWAIARKNNVSMRRLMETNGLQESSAIHPGQVLIIPAAGSSQPQNSAALADSKAPKTSPSKKADAPVVAKVEPAKAPVLDGDQYKVQKGDSLYLIASRFNTTVAAIKQENNLQRDMIRVGQSLRISGNGAASGQDVAASGKEIVPVRIDSALSEDGFLIHKVEAGEFPGLIARKYGMGINELLQLNDIRNPQGLQIGTELKVRNPDGQPATEASKTLMASTAAPKASEEAVAVRTLDSSPVMVEPVVDMVKESPVEKSAEFADFPIIRVGS